MNREEIALRPFHWWLFALIVLLTLSLGVTVGSLYHILKLTHFVIIVLSILSLCFPVGLFSYIQSQSVWLTGFMGISNVLLFIFTAIGVAIS